MRHREAGAFGGHGSLSIVWVCPQWWGSAGAWGWVVRTVPVGFLWVHVAFKRVERVE